MPPVHWIATLPNIRELYYPMQGGKTANWEWPGMLMAELSKRSGVPVATIKYYLREGLLPPGEATSATRADYGEHHLRRLRLIRALLEVGEVPLAGIGRILAAVDDESVSLHEVLGAVQYAL